MSASNRAGTSLSARYIGNVYAVQASTFGGETTAWSTRVGPGFSSIGRLRIVAGRINGLDDFIASPLYCNGAEPRLLRQSAQHSVRRQHLQLPEHHVGNARALGTGPILVCDGWCLQRRGLVFGPTNSTVSDFSIRHDSGVIGIMETGVMPEELGIVPRELPGHVKLGGYYDTEPLLDFRTGQERARDLGHVRRRRPEGLQRT